MINNDFEETIKIFLFFPLLFYSLHNKFIRLWINFARIPSLLHQTITGERGEEKNQDTLSTYTSEKLVWKGRPLNGGKVRSALNAQKVHTESAAQSKEKKLASGVGVK